MAICGDGKKEASETCDDSNAVSGDGCDLNCTVEGRYVCDGEGPNSCRCLELFTGPNCGECTDSRFTGSTCDQCQTPGGVLTTLECPQWLQSSANSLYFTKTEITVVQYEACVTAGACKPNHDSMTDSEYCSYGNENRSDHPMNCVNWTGAAEYCAWVGGRLPTEDEWYAEASNGGDRDYAWGDTPEASCDVCVMWESMTEGKGCGMISSWPVCSRPMGNSVSGLCDMSGNLWEWTTSEDNGERVVRGGSWYLNRQSYLQTSSRFFSGSDVRFRDYGFRCVSDTSL